MLREVEAKYVLVEEEAEHITILWGCCRARERLCEDWEEVGAFSF